MCVCVFVRALLSLIMLKIHTLVLNVSCMKIMVSQRHILSLQYIWEALPAYVWFC